MVPLYNLQSFQRTPCTNLRICLPQGSDLEWYSFVGCVDGLQGFGLLNNPAHDHTDMYTNIRESYSLGRGP